MLLFCLYQGSNVCMRVYTICMFVCVNVCIPILLSPFICVPQFVYINAYVCMATASYVHVI